MFVSARAFSRLTIPITPVYAEREGGSYEHEDGMKRRSHHNFKRSQGVRKRSKQLPRETDDAGNNRRADGEDMRSCYACPYAQAVGEKVEPLRRLVLALQRGFHFLVRHFWR